MPLLNTCIVKEICRKVDSLKNELVELCSGLVQINTVNPYAGGEITGSEKDGQLFLKSFMEEMDAKTKLFEPPPDIYKHTGVMGPVGRSWKGRPNLVSVFTFGKKGRKIVINSHMDTVGVTEMTIPPFSGSMKGGRIYGRGSSDDKGGMATGIIAIKAILDFADELDGEIIHQSVVDEECSGCGAGTLACLLYNYTGDEAVVIDGGGLKIVHGCQGVVTGLIKVTGLSGHAAYAGGVNAIEKALVVINEIKKFKENRMKKYPSCRFNLGMFLSGVQPSVVPGKAELGFNICYSAEEAEYNNRHGNGWNGSSVRKEFEHYINKTSSQDNWLQKHPARIEWTKDLVPFVTDIHSPVVRELQKSCYLVLGKRVIPMISPAWLDAANIAKFGIPVVAFGPASKNQAHSSAESICISDMVQCAKIMAVYLYRRLSNHSA